MEVQNLSTGNDRQKNITGNSWSLGICMYFQGPSKIIYIQQNTIMILKWTENRNVNQVGSVFLLSKQLLLDCLCFYLHQPKD